MKVKIFLPEYFYYDKKERDLFGDVSINNEKVTYFIIPEERINNSSFRKLGTVCSQQRLETRNCDFAFRFTFDSDLPHIFLSDLSIQTPEYSSISLILYDPAKVSLLEPVISKKGEPSDIALLHNLLLSASQDEPILWTLSRLFHLQFFCNLFAILFRQHLILWIKLLHPIFKKTAINRNFCVWRQCLKTYSLRNGKIWTLVLDVLAGVLIMLWILQLNDPSKWLMKISNDIISQLRTLLGSLKGSPVGLKLNVQLNNFLLDCFMYHVDLWAIFLKIINPGIQYLFIPITAIGFFGLSFQLAVLSDLIDLISLHAHCFYIYAAVLYNLEVVGMKALWMVVLGSRKNILKNRVESYEYISRQLYLATMFFTTFLFLFPTVLVYYIVFATLRACIYFVTYILMLLRRKILDFRVDSVIKHLFGQYFDLSGVNVQFIQIVKMPYRPTTTVLRIQMNRSSPWKDCYWYPKHSQFNQIFLSLGDFFHKLTEGEMMEFMKPDSYLQEEAA